MPSRRACLSTLGATGLAALGGCTTFGLPPLQMDSGTGKLHPSSERYLAHGLQPAGDDRVFATVAHDQAPALIGPDADPQIANELRYANAPAVTYLVLQLRSTPTSPMAIALDGLEWAGRDTLEAQVTVRPWGPLERIDDEQTRIRLQHAAELVYTSLWSFTPPLETLPDAVDLRLSHRYLDVDDIEAAE